MCSLFGFHFLCFVCSLEEITGADNTPNLTYLLDADAMD